MNELLVCDCCGWVEKPPFIEGDECICGGIFRKYDGKMKIVKKGVIEFAIKEKENESKIT